MGAVLGLGQSQKPPKIKPPPPPANPPTLANPAVSAAGAQSKAKSGSSFGGTIQTTPQGLQAPPVAQATLLGATG